MAGRFLFLVLSVFWIAAGSSAASAQSAAGVLNAFGFFGTWAALCGTAPGPANVVQTIAWTGREPVEYSVSIGAATNRYRVLTAQMPDAATLVLQVQLNGRLTENLTISKYGTDRIRTMTTQTSQGLLVRDGVVMATGQPTPWLQKCR